MQCGIVCYSWKDARHAERRVLKPFCKNARFKALIPKGFYVAFKRMHGEWWQTQRTCSHASLARVSLFRAGLTGTRK